MSIFNQEVNNKKITWPEFKFKTGKQIEVKIEQVYSSEIISTQKNGDKVLKENTEVKEAKEIEKNKIDKILNILGGSILRINGEEFQIHISISPGQEVTKDYIHKKVINPFGLINKWEYKNASLSYDKEDNFRAYNKEVGKHIFALYAPFIKKSCR